MIRLSVSHLRSAAFVGVMLLALSPQAGAATKAGVSAGVRGQVDLTSVTDSRTRRAQGGEDVFLGDGIRTQMKSAMQLLLVDQTTFTIGEETELTVDEYVYDPNASTGKLSASFTRGALRFVSGKISGSGTGDVKVDLPVATVGIRGTIVSFFRADNGFYVILEGPSLDNSALARRGLVQVAVGGRNITMRRHGIGLFIGFDGRVIGPFRVPADLRARFQVALAGGGLIGLPGLPGFVPDWPMLRDPFLGSGSGGLQGLEEALDLDLIDGYVPIDPLLPDELFRDQEYEIPQFILRGGEDPAN